MIELREIKKSFKEAGKKIEVLKGINLYVKKGERVCIIGPSGSGKTTLLSIIGTLLPPDEGKVLINGQEVTSLNSREISELRKNFFGFVFQSHYLIPELSVIENIILPGLVRGEKKERLFKKARKLGEALSIEFLFEKPVSHLSGGEKQRVAIVRALINDPSVILADEPTGNLDRENRDKVIQMLIEINKIFGSSLIIVTHDLEITTHFDKICFLEGGYLKIREKRRS